MGSENNIEVIIVKDSNEGGQKAFEIVKKELEKGDRKSTRLNSSH